MTADVGWTVTDPDGAIIDSGAPVVLTMVATSGDTPEGE